MRTKKLLIGLIVTTIVVTGLLMCIEAYYVAAALFIGAILVSYREIWALIKTGKIPPLDERMQEINSKSVRNGFVFLLAALAFMLLPFTAGMIEEPDTAEVLGVLLLAGAFFYFLSFTYYDRVEPKLTEKKLKVFGVFLLTAVISVPVFILGVFIHNAFDAIFGVEEPVFFILAVIVAPIGFGIGLLGSLVMYIIGLFSRLPDGSDS